MKKQKGAFCRSKWRGFHADSNDIKIIETFERKNKDMGAYLQYITKDEEIFHAYSETALNVDLFGI